MNPVSPLITPKNYNTPFTLKEHKDAIHKAHDTKAGPDDVPYQMLKHLPDESLLALLNIFNKIWITGQFLYTWSEATIIPIPKLGKDSTNLKNYQPIALTSCVCKTLDARLMTHWSGFLNETN
jgi:hypothetical protein